MATKIEPAERPARSKHDRRRRRWITLGILGAAFVLIAVIVLVVFQPQKLFLDDKVDEAVPVLAGPEQPPDTDAGAGSPTPPPTTPVTLRSGSFISRDHGTSGTALILDVGGARFVRIADLDTDNGPDLKVYLTTNPADGPEEAFDDDIVDLGGLKGNIGNQNYELPAEVDLDRYRSVVIWCDRFDAAFGAADLS
jgi:hypothetical protein